jgi:hypothetical protein
MSLTDEASFALGEAFGDMALGMQPPQLKFKDGDVLIRLSDDPNDHLLLHSHLLGEASERFRLRFKNSSFAGSRTVINPNTNENVTIFEYHLAHIEDTYCLTTKVRSCRGHHIL